MSKYFFDLKYIGSTGWIGYPNRPVIFGSDHQIYDLPWVGSSQLPDLT
jgi:hypothetical protein